MISFKFGGTRGGGKNNRYLKGKKNLTYFPQLSEEHFTGF